MIEIAEKVKGLCKEHGVSPEELLKRLEDQYKDKP